MPYNSKLVKLEKQQIQYNALVKALVKKGVISETEIENEILWIYPYLKRN